MCKLLLPRSGVAVLFESGPYASLRLQRHVFHAHTPICLACKQMCVPRWIDIEIVDRLAVALKKILANKVHERTIRSSSNGDSLVWQARRMCVYVCACVQACVEQLATLNGHNNERRPLAIRTSQPLRSSYQRGSVGCTQATASIDSTVVCLGATSCIVV